MTPARVHQRQLHRLWEAIPSSRLALRCFQAKTVDFTPLMGKPKYVVEPIPEHLILYTDERYLDDDDERRFVCSGLEDEPGVSASDEDKEDGTSGTHLDTMCATPPEAVSAENGWQSSEIQQPLDDTVQLVSANG